MTKIRRKSEKIRSYILKNINNYPDSISKKTCNIQPLLLLKRVEVYLHI